MCTWGEVRVESFLQKLAREWAGVYLASDSVKTIKAQATMGKYPERVLKACGLLNRG